MCLPNDVFKSPDSRCVSHRRWPQPWWMLLTLIIPYMKMAVTLYRVAILQLYFLNQGRSHKEYWVYLTHEENERP